MILSPGEIIAARYQIVSEIGRGGMARVYQAVQLNLGKQIALKVMSPELAVKADSRDRFRREAKVAAALHHPDAVHVFDFGEDRGQFYLAMELLDGESLQRHLEQRPRGVGLARAVDITHDVADVLVAAHAMPLIHRDLKPGNIFLDRAGDRVRVMDFGLAFIAGSAGDLGRFTEDGVGMGTPEYLSPEQAMVAEIGPATDIYSLGCVLFELITGRAPFVGGKVELVTGHCYRPPPTLAEIRPELAIPAVIEELVARMLDKRPDARPTADAVRTRLAGACIRGSTRSSAELSLARLQRMVDPPPVERTPAPLVAGQSVLVVVGELEDGSTTGLAANQLQVYREFDAVDRVDAVLLVSATPDTVAAQAARGVPVIAAAATDIDGVAQLLRAGAAEVCTLPLRVDDVAKKTLRAIRKHRSRK